MVALGIRGDEERRSNMGRETHLVEVEWEREPYWWKEKKYLWPVVAPSTGRVERTSPLPFADSKHRPSLTLRDDFERKELGLPWTFRRVPKKDAYSLIYRPGFLRLYSQSSTPAARGRVAQLGIKQTESDFIFTARTHFESQTMSSEAGITLFQKDDHFLNVVVKRQENGYELSIALADRGAPAILTSKAVPEYSGVIEWQLESSGKQYAVRYRFTTDSEWLLLHRILSNELLSHYYTGAHVGFYASSNGAPSADYVDIDWAEYQAKPRP